MRATAALSALLHRYRVELMPAWGVLVLYAVATLLFLSVPRLWPAGLPVGAAGTAAVVRWRTRRPRERIYAAAIGGGATTWGTFAWWAGPEHRLVVVGLLALWLAAQLPWLWHHRVEAVLASLWQQVLDPEGWRRERAVRRLVARWPELVQGVGLPGVQIHAATADRYGWTLVLRMPPQFSIADVTKQLPRLEAAFDARSEPGHHVRHGAVTIEPDAERASRCVLRISLREEPPEPAPAPEPLAIPANEPAEGPPQGEVLS